MTHDEITSALVTALAADHELDIIDMQALEAYAGQLYRMRAARDILEDEGLIWSSVKGQVAHPAVEIERQASQEMRQWISRRPDLFAPPEEVESPHGSQSGAGTDPGDGDVLAGL